MCQQQKHTGKAPDMYPAPLHREVRKNDAIVVEGRENPAGNTPGSKLDRLQPISRGGKRYATVRTVLESKLPGT